MFIHPKIIVLMNTGLRDTNTHTLGFLEGMGKINPPPLKQHQLLGLKLSLINNPVVQTLVQSS